MQHLLRLVPRARFRLASACAIGLASPVGAQTELYSHEGSTPWGRFARALSEAGDVDLDGVDDYVIGGFMSGGGSRGQVYVYSGATRQVLHTFSGIDENDWYGFSVSAAGDVDHDGHADILVGAVGDELPSEAPDCDRGLVRVHSGFDGSVLFEAYGGTCGEELGLSVSNLGDLDADGCEDYGAGSFSGVLHVWSGQSGSLLYTYQAASWTERFGKALSGAGDVNGDGHDDFVAGAEGGGYADVYSGSDGTLLWHFVGSNWFGSAVSTAGDVDLDGHADVVVGNVADGSPDISNAGSVSVYSGADGSRLYHLFGDHGHTELGFSVAGGVDLNGDGWPDFCAGAPNARMLGLRNHDAGAVRAYSGRDGSVLFTAFGLVERGRYAERIDILGDVDGDGHRDLLIGAPEETIYGIAHAVSGTIKPPRVYCQPGTDSAGCVPSIGFTGTASFSGPDDFHVTCTNMLSRQPATLLWDVEPHDGPWYGGTRCVRYPKGLALRFTMGNTTPDCSGSLDVHVPRSQMETWHMFPGLTIYLQFSYRDPGSAPPGSRTMTDALAVTLAP